jgi:hypothetical protein
MLSTERYKVAAALHPAGSEPRTIMDLAHRFITHWQLEPDTAPVQQLFTHTMDFVSKQPNLYFETPKNMVVSL